MAEDKNKQMFLSLIYSFQMQTMMQLGKLANPMTGKIENELDGAQVTIDMLDMLKAKTKGNVEEDEARFLNQVIVDLQMNYVEEREKEKNKPEIKAKGEEESSSEIKEKGEEKSSSKIKVKAEGDDVEATDSDNSLPPQE